LKTTAQQIAGTVALVCGLSQAVVHGAPPQGASQALLAASAVAQAGDEARAQVDQLLGRARQAMRAGDLAAAEKLIEQAESKKVRYGLFHLGDTPAKARQDLEAARRKDESPKLPSGKFNPLGVFGDPKPSTQDPFVVEREEPKPLPTSPDQLGTDSRRGRNIGLEPKRLAPVEGTPAFDAQSPATVEPISGLPAAAAGDRRRQSDKSLLTARRLLAVGDTSSAREALDEARKLDATYNFDEDSPAKVEAAIRKYEEIMKRPAGEKRTEAWRRQYAGALMEQAENLLRWKQFDEAERLAVDARNQGVHYSPFEVTPPQLLQRVAQQRKAASNPAAATVAAASGAPAPVGEASLQRRKQQVLALVEKARAAMAQGDLARAEQLAQQAKQIPVPDSAFERGEDRPWLVLLDLQKPRARGGVMNAAHEGSPTGDGYARQSLYDANADRTYNLPATAEELAEGAPPADAAQFIEGEAAPVSEGVRLFQQGEQALRDRDKETALRCFREAYQFQAELDPRTRQRLQDHLQMLAAPSAPPAEQPSLIEDAASRHRLMARQLSAEISRQQIEARRLTEKNPKQAMDLLEKARAGVAASGVEPAARESLLRRVDASIAELEKYVNAHRAEIELDEANRAVLDDIERRRAAKAEVQQKLADLVEEFNTLREQQRFAEMEVVAKRARELAPNEVITLQLWREARNLRRMMNQQAYSDKKEEGVFSAFESVRDASIPIDDRNPIIYPEAKEWDRISRSPARMSRDRNSRRTERELEIERKLKTPVSLRFQERPLAEVMDHLSRLAGINIHLDPRGLGEEGVTSSTPVTISLDNDISLKSALNLILEPLHLSYVIKDEVLKITSEQLRDGEVYTQTYNVADLVIPIPNFVPGNHLGLQGQLSDAYAAMGQGPAGMAGGPLAVMASADGQGGVGKINPQVLAQMPGGLGAMGGLRALGGMGGGPPVMGSGNPIMSGGPGGLGGAAAADFDSLIELLTTTIQPNTWDEVGGPGSVKEFRTNLSIVVSQTQDVHEEIVDLLEQLRRLQDLQVTIEVRFIRLNDSFFERIGLDFDFNIEDSTGMTIAQLQQADRVSPSASVGLTIPAGNQPFPNFTADLDIPFRQESFGLATPGFGTPVDVATFGFAILSDIEAYFLINASQGDRRSNVLQAPKVTLFNGQQAFVSDTSQTPFVISVIPVVGDFAAAQQPVIVVLSEGTFLTIQAVVSNDRRYVRLTVVPFFSQIGEVNEFTFEGSSTSTASSDESGLDDAGKPKDKKEEATRTRSGTTVQLPTFSFVTVTTTVSVPDGGTVLLGGIKRLSESRNEFGVPLLSKIPYIDRLFRNVGIGRETESLMMMVTPRIIIQEEEEERLGITAP
jgi:general secretion pathway protein D